MAFEADCSVSTVPEEFRVASTARSLVPVTSRGSSDGTFLVRLSERLWCTRPACRGSGPWRLVSVACAIMRRPVEVV